jgi:hypothetical protein
VLWSLSINGYALSLTEIVAQGATAWHNDFQTCSLDGKGGAVCVEGLGGFETTFTGTALPFITVEDNGAVAVPTLAAQGGGSSSGGGSGTAPKAGGGAARVNGGISLGWTMIGTVVAVGAGMRMVL